jgi:GGDEF domain-containing protein
VFAALLDGAADAGHDENEIVGSASLGEDITGQRNYAARIGSLAAHDGLTGLPNRTRMHERVIQVIAHARHHGSVLAVQFIKLDRFEVINDGFITGRAALLRRSFSSSNRSRA